MLPVASALLYLVALAMFLRLHVRDRSVDWVRDPVSYYGIGKVPRYFRVYGHIGTAGAALLTIQFFTATAPAFPVTVLLSMALLILFRVGVFAVPADSRNQPASLSGRIHLLFAIAAFAATYTAIANATPYFADARAFAFLVACRYTAMLGLACVVVTMFSPLKRFFGLAERAFLFSTMVWFLLASASFAAADKSL